MQIIRCTWRRLLADTRGVTALEYGMIAALIAVVAVSGFSLVGGGLTSTLLLVTSAL